jgi:hypothetical protein
MQSDEPAQMERDHRLEFVAEVLTWLWGGIALVAVGCFFGSILSLIYEIFFWLRYGFWLGFEFGRLLYWAGANLPIVNWVGVQKVLVWVSEWPLWAGLIVSGILVGLIGAAFGRVVAKVWESARPEWKSARVKSKSI